MASTTKLASLAYSGSSFSRLLHPQQLLSERRCLCASASRGLASSSGAGKELNSRTVLLGGHVSEALKNGEPVVALESTLLTHGLPEPENLEVGLRLEAQVRAGGAVPATVAVLKGRFIVGLSEEELRFLADVSHSKPMKASRRDLPIAAALGLNAGTTVAATLAIASEDISSSIRSGGARRPRIKVFATGGTGGVHEGGQSSMDISADLEELARSPMGLVSAGFKSFLDARRSLEYLETRGCPVVSLNGYLGHFPAFFSPHNPRKPLKSPHNVTSIEEAARILFECLEGQLRSRRGLLLAVPIPEQWSLGEQDWELLERIRDQVEQNVTEGSRKSPMILEELKQATEGRSLLANRALLENNAYVGGRLALEYELLASATTKLPVVGDMLLQHQGALPNAIEENKHSDADAGVGERKQSIDAVSNSSVLDSKGGKTGAPEAGRPTVVGCTMIDLHVATRVDHRFKNNPPNSGITFAGKPRLTLGGVGQNLATGLALLGHQPVFISSLSRDNLGDFALSELAKIGLLPDGACGEKDGGSLRLAWHQAKEHPTINQDSYSSCFALVLVDSIGGQCEYVIADLEAATAINRSHIEDNLEQIKSSPLLVMDANLQSETIDYLISVATAHRVPIFLEPTDASLQSRLVACLRRLQARQAPLLCMSPNLVELRQMVALFEGLQLAESSSQVEDKEEEKMSLGQVERLAERLMRVHLPQLRCLLVTMDQRGVLVVLRGSPDSPMDSLDAVHLMSLPMDAGTTVGLSVPAVDDGRGQQGTLLMKHFQVPQLIEAPISGSGAGDSLAAGFMSGLLRDSNVATCIQLGFKAAQLALQSRETIPKTLRTLVPGDKTLSPLRV